MQSWLAKLLILVFAGGIVHMHAAASLKEDHATLYQEIIDAGHHSILTDDDCEDDQDCQCPPWQCQAGCQRCAFTPGMIAAILTPLLSSSNLLLGELSPKALIWIESCDRLLDPPRLS